MTVSAFAPSDAALFKTRDVPVRTLQVATWMTTDKVPVTSKLPAWLEVVEDRFNEVMRFSKVGNHGLPISPHAIVSALQLLGRIMSPDSIAPLVVPRYNGGIQLEWHTNGVDLEIEIEPEGKLVSAWCEHTSGREWEDEGELRISRIRKELSLLVQDDA